VQVHHEEGVATHVGRESCSRIREDVSEVRVPTRFRSRKARLTGAPARVPGRPGVVEDPGMCGRSLDGRSRV
jgi:hypothetical protein